MKTRCGWLHLRGLFQLSAAVAVGSALCTSAFAGPMTYRESVAAPRTAQNMSAQKTIKIYVLTSASAIPKPVTYVIGGIMTTASPIQIIGRGENVTR